MNHIDILNRRLGESLGLVCGGSLPRFAWKWAPDMPWFTYDLDGMTVVKKCWADMAAPDGGVVGPVWILAEWRVSKAFDHMGLKDGVRVARTHDAGYAPYFETAMARDRVPTDELTANYIWAIRQQMENSFETYMGEEKWTADQNDRRSRNENLERAATEYDKYVGGFGNLEPGLKDGFLSWGGVGDSPVVRKIQETTAATASGT